MGTKDFSKLMITPISSKKLGVYKIMRNTVFSKTADLFLNTFDGKIGKGSIIPGI